MSGASREFTPTMDRLRADYLDAIKDRGFADLYAAEWDRALEAHNARIASEAGEKALREAADHPEDMGALPWQAGLHARADRVAKERAIGRRTGLRAPRG